MGPPDASAGVAIGLYVEAEAEDADVEEPGWPSGGTTVRSLGWASGTVTYVEAQGEDTDGEGPKGCGCASGDDQPLGWAWVLAVLLSALRKRVAKVLE